MRLYDLHLQDASNLQHPSYFDSTNDYDMLVFRKLGDGGVRGRSRKGRVRPTERRMLQEIVTRPITFFLLERLLVTVRQGTSKTIEQVRQRLLDPARARRIGSPFDRSRLPKSPGELMLRMLNGMVDRYLELREPLSDRLDRWQRDLLDPRRPVQQLVGAARGPHRTAQAGESVRRPVRRADGAARLLPRGNADDAA